MCENRVYSRVAYEANVEIAVGDNEKQSGILQNISRGGALVKTLPPPMFGTRVTLFIDLPGIPDTCKIPCIVRWIKQGHGAGLQFEHLRPIEVWAFNKLLRSLSNAKVNHLG
ncbi:MAG: PilZ domain-containing protein [Proteobacteria bacterium]|nr:PilZ domain-containing protein [Pseudomonadota bacterium]